MVRGVNSLYKSSPRQDLRCVKCHLRIISALRFCGFFFFFARAEVFFASAQEVGGVRKQARECPWKSLERLAESHLTHPQMLSAQREKVRQRNGANWSLALLYGPGGLWAPLANRATSEALKRLDWSAPVFWRPAVIALAGKAPSGRRAKSSARGKYSSEKIVLFLPTSFCRFHAVPCFRVFMNFRGNAGTRCRGDRHARQKICRQKRKTEMCAEKTKAFRNQ